MSGGRSKSKMLLLELLLAVFIFSFCAVICASVFFAAGRIADDSLGLTRSVAAATSAAECFRLAESLGDLAQMLGGRVEDGKCVVEYDKNWQLVSGDPVFRLTVVIESDGNVQHAGVEVWNLSANRRMNSEPLPVYSLTCSKYAPEVTG